LLYGKVIAILKNRDSKSRMNAAALKSYLAENDIPDDAEIYVAFGPYRADDVRVEEEHLELVETASGNALIITV
jgi:hypothetical protein